MKTPIHDFIKKYTEKDPLRLHMPGHKGMGELEKFDLTEVSGADSLFEANGIIKESEENASSIFGAHTFYSTEGSSLCIRAMMLLCSLYAKENGVPFKVLAYRNVHKSFISASALIGFDPVFIGAESGSYLSVKYDLKCLEKALKEERPFVLYVTSPDYLGNCADISEISILCKKYGVLLAVDNAHGSYLKFLPESRHPIDLGADICCDSAHKTLPVLTGGSYLHISNNAPEVFIKEAKNSLSVFASTSPSYLILRSLDLCNLYLSDGYKNKLWEFTMKADALKKRLKLHGYTLCGNEPLKITLLTKPYGYTGNELAELLEEEEMFCEFCDPDHLTLMLTPELGDCALDLIYKVFTSIPEKAPILKFPPRAETPERAMSIRDAVLSAKESISTDDAEGRILASSSVGCPPAVPIAVCGEILKRSTLDVFKYYGINKITVVK